MFTKTFACLKFLLIGWMGVAVLQAAGRGLASSPLELSSPAQPVRAAAAAKPEISAAAANLAEKWRLCGTLVRDGHSRAVIEEVSSGKQFLIAAGESLDGNAVKMISRGEIFFAGGASLIASSEGWDRISRKEQPRPAALPAESPSQLSDGANLSAQDVRQVGMNEFEVPERFFRNLAEQIPHILDSLGLMVFEGEGGMAGYLLSRDDTTKTIEALGIQDGDLILKVNGRELKTDDDVFSAFAAATRQKEIRLEVERDEEIRVLTYHVQK